MNEQIEFFHKEEEKPKGRRRHTYKETFRMMNGYDREHKCGDCMHFVRAEYNRVYYKCEILGLSGSASTDIRVSDPACKLFKEI